MFKDLTFVHGQNQLYVIFLNYTVMPLFRYLSPTTFMVLISERWIQYYLICSEQDVGDQIPFFPVTPSLNSSDINLQLVVLSKC